VGGKTKEKTRRTAIHLKKSGYDNAGGVSVSNFWLGSSIKKRTKEGCPGKESTKAGMREKNCTIGLKRELGEEGGGTSPE